MISEVPLGAFLSVVVDSSAVVAMMAGQSAEPVNTCSISFDDPAYDETRFAQQVADRITPPRRRAREPRRLRPDRHAAALYDEPFAGQLRDPDLSVRQLACRHVTVACRATRATRTWRLPPLPVPVARGTAALAAPAGNSPPLFGALGRLYPWTGHPASFARSRPSRPSPRDSVDGYFHSISVFRDDLRQRLYSPEFKRRLAATPASEVFHRHAQRAGTDDPLALISSTSICRPTWWATSTRKSTAPAWPTLSKSASR
jgi:asparagine synthase (glutamine-hydrolysing)